MTRSCARRWAATEGVSLQRSTRKTQWRAKSSTSTTGLPVEILRGEPRMRILGLNAFHADASAALLVNGQLAFALEEERLNRIRHWAGFPALAARACLDASGSAPPEHVAISREPRAHFWTKVGRLVARPGDWRRTASR